ncbi:MAG: SprT family zinc-dependent metalloprotease [Methylobacterium frigidaeris]
MDPNGSVTVYAPSHATDDQILERVNRKAPWIQRQRGGVAARGPASASRHFVSGESHLLLGVTYRLAIEVGPEAFAQIDGPRLVVTARDPNDAGHVRRVLESFYRLKGREVFPERLTSVMPPFARRGLNRPKLIIRRLQKRWGSFTPQGRIVLNTDLVRASPSQIDYVLCHELAHAFHPNHSQKWRELLTTIMPDWTHRKELLEQSLR